MLECNLSPLLCGVVFIQVFDDSKLYYHDFIWHFLLENGSVWVLKGNPFILTKKLPEEKANFLQACGQNPGYQQRMVRHPAAYNSREA